MMRWRHLSRLVFFSRFIHWSARICCILYVVNYVFQILISRGRAHKTCATLVHRAIFLIVSTARSVTVDGYMRSRLHDLPPCQHSRAATVIPLSHAPCRCGILATILLTYLSPQHQSVRSCA
ncbi:hypothetical protein FA95DRAFT_264513 [Auriscalpium vulgare]|uniref:Uncharacterized protein n=1 Tax=Auriscalpium vulgare TaxID=40419 RepID=A0ACB8RLF4_9AGAM|nr:hypothetical protein FA95DRAFT_264513 [Auriscalpium vulgare]